MDEIELIIDDFCNRTDDHAILKRNKSYVLFRWRISSNSYRCFLNLKTKSAFCWDSSGNIYYSDKMLKKPEHIKSWKEFWTHIGKSKDIIHLKSFRNILNEIKICQI